MVTIYAARQGRRAAPELGLSAGKNTNKLRPRHVHAHGMYENVIHTAYYQDTFSIVNTWDRGQAPVPLLGQEPVPCPTQSHPQL